MGNQTKSISLPEGIVMVLLALSADGLEAFSDVASPVPIIGQALVFLNPIADAGVLAIIQFWLIMKRGIPAKFQLSMLGFNSAEFVPLLDVLPAHTGGLLWVIYQINSSASPGPAEEPVADEEEKVPEEPLTDGAEETF